MTAVQRSVAGQMARAIDKKEKKLSEAPLYRRGRGRPLGAPRALRGGRVLLREALCASLAVAGVEDGRRHSDQTDEDKARRRAEGPVERSIVSDSQNCQDVCHENEASRSAEAFAAGWRR